LILVKSFLWHTGKYQISGRKWR